MEKWKQEWKPERYLARDQEPGFGVPRDKENPIKWRPWSEEKKWGVSLAYQQHRLAMQLNRILAGKATAADDFVPPEKASKIERREALAAHLNVPDRTLQGRLKGETACTARELLGWISVAGIDFVPAAVADLLPSGDEIDAGT